MTRLIGLRHLNHSQLLRASVILPTKQEGMRVYNMPHLAQLRRLAGLFGEYYCLTGLCAARRAKPFLSRQIQQGQLGCHQTFSTQASKIATDTLLFTAAHQ